MKFECPSCNKGNDLDIDTAICCSHCETSFDGIKFQKIKSALFGTAMTFIAGGIIFDKAEDYMFGERLPIALEFEIVQSCVDSDDRSMSSSVYKKKKQSCLCGLEETLDELDYGDFKDSPIKFQALFSRKARQCL
jgi:hypothetical protein